MFFRRHLWSVLYSLFLAAFTVYIAMDTFVITRVYEVVPESKNEATSSVTSSLEQSDNDSSATNEDDITVSESAYNDSNIDITITEYREYDTSIYVADVVLSSPEYLKTAFAQNAYGRNVTEKTSEIAETQAPFWQLTAIFTEPRRMAMSCATE